MHRGTSLVSHDAGGTRLARTEIWIVTGRTFYSFQQSSTSGLGHRSRQFVFERCTCKILFDEPCQFLCSFTVSFPLVLHRFISLLCCTVSFPFRCIVSVYFCVLPFQFRFDVPFRCLFDVLFEFPSVVPCQFLLVA